MSSSRWREIERLFHAALEREPGTRNAFLDEACSGDLELRREVDSLLASAGNEGAFMNRPAIELEAETMSHELPGTLSGRWVAHYLIGPLLGVGGMAEVYRARDSRLDRDVAIKVLFASSFGADGFDRFQREARLLALVIHPNVAAVYGFEQIDNRGALIMEVIEGETLSERIGRQRLSVDEALSIAGQIAAAVEAAHAKAIIHRDLKPSNIRLGRDGNVKVLDFGLAKLLRPAEDLEVSSPMGPSTQGLSIVGTVAYMSPEQARGRPVGRPADVWAWGCVLYELLTGVRAFEGATVPDTLAKIASEGPDWTRLPSATPSAVRSLLEDCLQKNSASRLRDIAEARRRLENASLNPAPSTTGVDIALSLPAARGLFLFIQCGFLAMYSAALYYVNAVGARIVPVVVVTAMSGIAVRLFLISSVALAHPNAGRQFRRLFPFLLLLDAAWAASPLLAVSRIGIGVALAGAAGLAYLPFSQRTLMRRIYGA
jgi:eukaryotic-like serine/threonine-protein kinase